MKKIFTSIMLLLAIAVGTTLVSCNKKNDEKKYNAEEQANKLDATGEAFIAELDLDNWKATADLVIPGIMFLQNADIPEAEAPVIETKENNVYTIDMTGAKGHYTLDAEGKGAKVAGDFKDFQIAYAAEGHNYVADITFTNSDKTIILNEYEDETTILKVPATMKAEFTVDGKKQFTAEGALTFNGYESLEEAPVVKDITVDVNLTVTAGDYALNLSRLSLKNGTFDEALTFKHNKKLLLSVTSKATGIALLDTPKSKVDYDGDGIDDEPIAEGDSESDIPFACDNASLTVDVLGQVQVKGNLKFNDAYNTYLGLASTEPKNVEEANALLKKLEPYYNLNVYYDGGSTVQAYARIKALQEGEMMHIAPVIFFQDGTSQAVTEFFDEDNFTKTIAAIEALMTKVQNYFESMQPEDVSEELTER